jgi:hypothetical protein
MKPITDRNGKFVGVHVPDELKQTIRIFFVMRRPDSLEVEFYGYDPKTDRLTGQKQTTVFTKGGDITNN